MSELIEGIELVKMYSWEMEIYKLILKKREEEVNNIKKIGYYLTFVRGFWEASVLISAICIFAPYVVFTG